eukprot:UN07653
MKNIKGLDRRFITSAGAFGDVQLKWLKDELQIIKSKKQKVIICSHVPSAVPKDSEGLLMWDYEEF